MVIGINLISNDVEQWLYGLFSEVLTHAGFCEPVQYTLKIVCLHLIPLYLKRNFLIVVYTC